MSFAGAAGGLVSNILKNGPAYVQLGAESFDPNAVAMRRDLESDTARLREGKLGPSQAQRAAVLGQFSRVAQAQQQAQASQLAGQAAAAGNLGRAGSYFQGQQATQQAAQQATAQQAAAIEQQAAQAAFQEAAAVRERQETQRQRLWKMWGIGGAPTPIATAVGSLPSDIISGAAGAGAAAGAAPGGAASPAGAALGSQAAGASVLSAADASKSQAPAPEGTPAAGLTPEQMEQIKELLSKYGSR